MRGTSHVARSTVYPSSPTREKMLNETRQDIGVLANRLGRAGETSQRTVEIQALQGLNSSANVTTQHAVVRGSKDTDLPLAATRVDRHHQPVLRLFRGKLVKCG